MRWSYQLLPEHPLVESWAGIAIDGLPSLDDQIRLFHRSVMSAFSSDRGTFLNTGAGERSDPRRDSLRLGGVGLHDQGSR